MSTFSTLAEAAEANQPTTAVVLAKKDRTTKVEKVVVHRRTLTVQSRTVAWAAGGLFVAGFALGQWNPPAETPAGASTAQASTTVETVTAVSQPSGK